jgi:hypothetical protein
VGIGDVVNWNENGIGVGIGIELGMDMGNARLRVRVRVRMRILPGRWRRNGRRWIWTYCARRLRTGERMKKMEMKEIH